MHKCGDNNLQYVSKGSIGVGVHIITVTKSINTTHLFQTKYNLISRAKVWSVKKDQQYHTTSLAFNAINGKHHHLCRGWNYCMTS